MKKHQIMISSLAVLALSCSSAWPESCGEGCSYTLTTAEDGHTIATIDNTTTSIPENAFRDRRDISEVIIPDSVTTIGDYAFEDMWNLQSLTIGKNVTTIGDLAFRNIYKITNLTIPNSVTSIGTEAFAGMQSLQSLTIPDSVTSIADWAFASLEGLTNFTIPDSVTSIGESAFDSMINVASLTIGKNVKTIGRGAFDHMLYDTQIYCEEEICATLDADRSYYGFWGNQTLIPYTKDKDGVYKVGDVFYSSSENMQAGISCESQAACAEEIKSANQTSSDEPTHIVRRIYTVEEATEAVSGKGKNTFTIRYR